LNLPVLNVTKEKNYERLGYWVCVVILIGLAVIISVGMAESLITGQARTVSKSGSGSLILKQSDPVRFFCALVPHALILGVFAYGAYWVWLTYLRRR
jgi:hypothetical protein